MMTLRQFASPPDSIPTATAWLLADLGQARGRQELFTRQSPQKLKALREHALIESAVASNRIEGVTVDQARVATLVFGRPAPRDRDEEEVRGYREALRLVHEGAAGQALSMALLLRLHGLCRGRIWDAGKLKEKDVDIIEKHANGRQRVRFRTVPAAETSQALAEMLDLYAEGSRQRWVHPLILLAGMNLDFLCIHPFRDGNGRVSRLLLLLCGYQQGYEVGRYVSLERIIEQNKDRYYETLAQSSHGWHEGTHDPWPYVNYLLFVLTSAYREFEDRIGQTPSPRGAKTALVRGAILRRSSPFRIAEIQADCLGVSVHLIRRVLRRMRQAGQVECLGRGQSARWRRIGK